MLSIYKSMNSIFIWMNTDDTFLKTKGAKSPECALFVASTKNIHSRFLFPKWIKTVFQNLIIDNFTSKMSPVAWYIHWKNNQEFKNCVRCYPVIWNYAILYQIANFATPPFLPQPSFENARSHQPFGEGIQKNTTSKSNSWKNPNMGQNGMTQNIT